MAIGNFADLSSARQVATQRMLNQQSPLDAAIQGMQQGIQLRQLPQTIQDQALERELRNALMQQKLNDMRNPNAALARRVQEELAVKGALNPDLGIRSSPVGLENEIIANPGAITPAQQAALPSPEMMEARKIAEQQAGVAIPALPTAQGGGFDVPVQVAGIPTGSTTNRDIFEEGKRSKIDELIRLAQAKGSLSSASGAGRYMFERLSDGTIIRKDRMTGEVSAAPSPEDQILDLTPKAKQVTVTNPNTGMPEVVNVDPSGRQIGVVGNKPVEGKLAYDENNNAFLVQPNTPIGAGPASATPVMKGSSTGTGEAFKGLSKGKKASEDDEYKQGLMELKASNDIKFAIKELKELKDRTNSLTTGAGGWALKNLPFTDAGEYESTLSGALDRGANRALMEMKLASKSGASGLGAVSNFEQQQLRNIQLAIKQGNRPEFIKSKLNELIGRLEEWEKLKTQHADEWKKISTGDFEMGNFSGKGAGSITPPEGFKPFGNGKYFMKVVPAQ